MPDPTPPIPAEDELAALRAIVEGTVSTTGSEFFQTLVRHLARVMDTRYAFVAEFLGDNRVRTLAFFVGGQLVPNAEWDLDGHPCEKVVNGNLCHYPENVAAAFPRDPSLVQLGIQSYLGVPLEDATGKHLGHLAVCDAKPMPAEPRKLMTFRIFAARAAAEIARLRDKRMLAESEQRFRDLFDEAPIAYVHEGLDSRFLHANHAALRTLGITPDQVDGTFGSDFIPTTPDARRRFDEAFATISRGATTGPEGLLLELRRKDNGQPIWIQWWSRPDPSGQSTRTMFLDVTDRVLMEREKARLELQNSYLREEIKSVHNFEEIVGRSPALQSVLASVRQVAPTDASVLIRGETGTGKELVARAIHNASSRKDRPLIKVNCAALPTGLVESELFGHERGAFSGAIAKRIGRFELAAGGTIFLDEVGELPLDTQSKLLRVLQEREFERVGGTATLRADVRVIAATNRNLEDAVRETTFRQDLFYRLNVFPITLPPLRERTEDIPLLVQFLIERSRNRLVKRLDNIDPASLHRLLAYPWPGNIRELENVLERAAILATTPTIHIDPMLLPPLPPIAFPPPAEGEVGRRPGEGSPVTSPTSTSLESIERAHILATLSKTLWVIDGDRGAALLLNLHPNTLRSRMKKLGITRPPRT